jgi:Zn-dependent peptidase ImmA (M78 family)
VDTSVDVQARAASELATFAVGWALLHELQHIRHQHERTSTDLFDPDSEPDHAEELSCDRFATQFLLEKADDYAESEQVAPERVRQKRELGVYFALFALTLLAKKNWGDTQTHPAVQKRIEAAIVIIGPAASEPARAVAHMAFAALRCFWPGAPGVF